MSFINKLVCCPTFAFAPDPSANLTYTVWPFVISLIVTAPPAVVPGVHVPLVPPT